LFVTINRKVSSPNNERSRHGSVVKAVYFHPANYWWRQKGFPAKISPVHTQKSHLTRGRIQPFVTREYVYEDILPAKVRHHTISL